MPADHPVQPSLDLLVLDEMQDLQPDWMNALSQRLLPQGSCYLLTDEQQRIYDGTSHQLPDAVQIRCLDNFRSPRRLVQAIKQLQLCDETIQARAPHHDDVPVFLIYQHTDPEDHTAKLDACVRDLMLRSIPRQHIVLLSMRGQQSSQRLKQDSVAGSQLKKTTGIYDA